MVAAAVAGLSLVLGCTGRTTDAGRADTPGTGAVASGVLRIAPADRGPAPRVTGETLAGEPFDLRALRGDVVVVNFWGSWCAPCRVEAAGLQAVHMETKRDGVAFVGVNIRDARDKARAFERSFGVTYPSLYDPEGRVALAFRETPPVTTPATLVLDRRGRVAVVLRKAVLPADLRPVIAAVVAER